MLHKRCGYNVGLKWIKNLYGTQWWYDTTHVVGIYINDPQILHPKNSSRVERRTAPWVSYARGLTKPWHPTAGINSPSLPCTLTNRYITLECLIIHWVRRRANDEFRYYTFRKAEALYMCQIAVAETEGAGPRSCKSSVEPLLNLRLWQVHRTSNAKSNVGQCA